MSYGFSLSTIHSAVQSTVQCSAICNAMTIVKCCWYCIVPCNAIQCAMPGIADVFLNDFFIKEFLWVLFNYNRHCWAVCSTVQYSVKCNAIMHCICYCIVQCNSMRCTVQQIINIFMNGFLVK